ncbi:hypothetical protein ABES80_17390 [Bacillus gobiensis]|uniref:hypothetical protein n=1 Tax=Bacillus gobiensis TaxID=1441095 RepID=UPI003D19DB6A
MILAKKCIYISSSLLLFLLLASCGEANQIKITEFTRNEKALLEVTADQYFSATLTGLTDEVYYIGLYAEHYENGKLLTKYGGGADLNLLREKKDVKGLRAIFILEEDVSAMPGATVIKMGLNNNRGVATKGTERIEVNEYFEHVENASGTVPKSITIGEPVLIGCTMKDSEEIEISGEVTHSNIEELINHDEAILYYVMAN